MLKLFTLLLHLSSRMAVTPFLLCNKKICLQNTSTLSKCMESSTKTIRSAFLAFFFLHFYVFFVALFFFFLLSPVSIANSHSSSLLPKDQKLIKISKCNNQMNSAVTLKVNFWDSISLQSNAKQKQQNI